MTHPVEAAIAPLREEAKTRAQKDAIDLIDRLLKVLEENGWDLKVVAPRPNGGMSRDRYMKMNNTYSLYSAITTYDKPVLRMNEPEIRRQDDYNEAYFVNNAIDTAIDQYDAFVAKMVKKIGDCDSATLDGSHVWGWSILTVKKGDTVERWKTQQIVNVSKLGLLFNQWPSRKMK